MDPETWREMNESSFPKYDTACGTFHHQPHQPIPSPQVPVVAVLMLILDGDSGTLLLRESIQSFISPCEITGLFIADLSMTARNLDDLLPRLPSHLGVKEVFHLPNIPKDAAFNHLRGVAMGCGFNRALHGCSNEILKQQVDSQPYESLPVGWTEADILQTVSNVSHRPQVDVFVNLTKFNFLGAMYPCPVPLNLHSVSRLVALPWMGSCVDVNTYMVSPAEAFCTLSNLKEVYKTYKCYKGNEEEADDDAGPSSPYSTYYRRYQPRQRSQPPNYIAQGVLMHQITLSLIQLRLHHEAYALVSDWIDAEHPYGDEDGLYLAHIIKAQCADELNLPLKDQLHNLVIAAEKGLALRRFEGVVLLSSILGKNDKHFLGMLALASLSDMPLHTDTEPNAWMGNPSSFSCELRESLAVNMFHIGGKVIGAAHEQLLTAIKHPSSKFNKQVQLNYKNIARYGDDVKCMSAFPGIPDFQLAEIIVQSGFLSADKLAGTCDTMLEHVNKESFALPNWCWLKYLFQNAVHSPMLMSWACTFKMVVRGTDRTENMEGNHCPLLLPVSIFIGETLFVSSGYVFLLLMRDLAPTKLHLRIQSEDSGISILSLRPGVLYAFRALTKYTIQQGDGTDATTGTSEASSDDHTPCLLMANLAFSKCT